MTGGRYHLRGVLLPGDDEVDLWVADGVLHSSPVPDAEPIMDGGFLVPGLVDAHCHVGLGPHGAVDLDEAAIQAETDRDTGTLLIRDCGVPIDNSPLQDRADLPRIIRAGTHLARPRRYLPHISVELDNEEQLPDAVALQAKRGDGWVKLIGDWIDRDAGDLRPLWSDAVLAEAVAAAHEHGARVTAHVFSADAITGLLAAGIDCLEHATGVTDESIEEMARRGVALVPTLINIGNFPDIAARGAARFPTYAAHMRALYDGHRGRIGAAIDAGVPVYTGTDAGSTVAHGRIVDEIAALHAIGMSRADAIGAASWRARGWLGLPDMAGGVVDGAPADLVGYDADPRADLEVLRHPSRLLLRGALLPVPPAV
ncbi:MAG TPA: amidohydrolase family protein [Pseudonocardiaceae bacterium]|jgi:imidazolonepropionase-like amidohydrolase